MAAAALGVLPSVQARVPAGNGHLLLGIFARYAQTLQCVQGATNGTL